MPHTPASTRSRSSADCSSRVCAVDSPWRRAISSASVMPWAWAARISGVSRSTIRRRLPGGVTALSCACRAAPTAPQLSWLSTTTSGTSSTAAPYSMLARTSAPTRCPAVRTTKRSPRPRSKMISAATRESEHPNSTANGRCTFALAARRAASWFGWSASPATNRWLPSSRYSSASSGVMGQRLTMSPVVSVCTRQGKGAAPGLSTAGAASALPAADDVHDAAPGGDDDGLQLAVDAELAHEALDVAADAVHGEPEQPGDLHGVLPVREPLQHLVLARGQPGRRPGLAPLLGQGGAEPAGGDGVLQREDVPAVPGGAAAERHPTAEHEDPLPIAALDAPPQLVSGRVGVQCHGERGVGGERPAVLVPHVEGVEPAVTEQVVRRDPEQGRSPVVDLLDAELAVEEHHGLGERREQGPVALVGRGQPLLQGGPGGAVAPDEDQ